MRDRGALHGAHDRARVEGEGPSRFEVDAGAAAGAEGPEPDLRALEILQDGDRPVPARRDTLIAHRSAEGHYVFDIVMQGPHETVFFDV